MKEKLKLFLNGFIQGMGWSFGVTLGFIIISILLVYVLKLLGGMPLIGNFIAGIVESTLEQIKFRTPYIQ
jgi:hypothetical protein